MERSMSGMMASLKVDSVGDPPFHVRGVTPLIKFLRALFERREDFEALGAFSHSFVVHRLRRMQLPPSRRYLCREVVAAPATWGDTISDAVQMVTTYVLEWRFLWRASAPAPMAFVDDCLRSEALPNATLTTRWDLVR